MVEQAGFRTGPLGERHPPHLIENGTLRYNPSTTSATQSALHTAQSHPPLHLITSLLVFTIIYTLCFPRLGRVRTACHRFASALFERGMMVVWSAMLVVLLRFLAQVGTSFVTAFWYWCWNTKPWAALPCSSFSCQWLVWASRWSPSVSHSACL